MPSEEEEDEVNRRTSESKARTEFLAMPSEEEEDEVNSKEEERALR